jgi:hypothetical protein
MRGLKRNDGHSPSNMTTKACLGETSPILTMIKTHSTVIVYTNRRFEVGPLTASS